MKRLLQVGSCSVMMLIAFGCSSSQMNGSSGDQIAAADDAGTDAIPPNPDAVPPNPDAVPPTADQAQATPPPSETPPTAVAADAGAVPPAPSTDGALTTPVAPAAPEVAAAAPSTPSDNSAPAAPVSPSSPPSNDMSVASAAPSAPSSSGETENYTVQSGDTLMKIAFEHYGDLYRWKDIYNANKDQIPNPTALTRGTVLKLDKSESVAIDRNGDKYLIHEGDTLGTISDDVYGMKTKWKRLWENNKQLIKNPNRIFAGFYLYYMMTDQDRAEKEDALKNKGQEPTMAPNPLSQAPAAPSVDSARAPSSVAPAMPTMPSMPTIPPQQSAQVTPTK
jgi:nucleoid-associated protein YgaU